MKLEHRLTLLTASVTAGTIAACLFTAYWLVQRAASAELDELVVDGANAMALVVSDNDGRLKPLDSIQLDVPGHVVRIAHHFAIFDGNGPRIASTTRFVGVPNTLGELRDLGLPFVIGKPFDLRNGAEAMRAVVVEPTQRPELRVLHAVPREPTDTSIASQRQVFLILFTLSLVLVVLGARWLGRRLASDVNHITEVARRVGSGDLTARAGTSHLTSPETRNLAVELNQMIAELLTLLSSQRNFISYAAHELRSPLTALQGELQLALRRPRSSESYVETLGKSLSEVQELAQLAEDLLTLARAQGQTEALSVSLLDEVIDEALRLVHGAAQVKEATIICTVDEVRSAHVLGHRSDLARALRNLLENAVKYGPRSDTVSLTGTIEGTSLWLAVEDHGPGISECDLDALFQPFYRGPSHATVSTAGTGLGLAIAREIARNAGGDIECVEPDRPGARFRIRLAIARSSVSN